MEVKLVYDIFGPSGPFANGWNYNYLDVAWEHNFAINHNLIKDFNKKYTHMSVYDCNLNLSTHRVEKIHISDITINEAQSKAFYKSESDDIFLYTIHPFGSVNTCLGNSLNYHQNTHCFEFISIYAKKYVQDVDNFYLTIDYSSEGDIRSDMFKNLHEICEKLNINPSKVIIITSAMNSRDLYQSYLVNNPQEKQFYTAYYPWPVLPKRGELRTYFQNPEDFSFNGFTNKISFMTEDDFKNNTQREKKCLIFNRRVAPHRVILLSLLQNENLLEKVEYSIDLSMSGYNDIGLELSSGTDYDGVSYIKDKKYKSNMINGSFILKKINKKTIDYDDIAGVWGFGFEHKESYLKTYFSVITETIFYEHGHYISEKSFKGFQHLHPFVIVGKPGILKYLKSKGFKTFSEFWDESYDEIHDNSERMILVYKVIKKLILKTDEEWIELNKKLLPILLHNRENLLSFDEKIVSDTYINNLHNLLEHEPNQENYFLL